MTVVSSEHLFEVTQCRVEVKGRAGHSILASYVRRLSLKADFISLEIHKNTLHCSRDDRRQQHDCVQ